MAQIELPGGIKITLTPKEVLELLGDLDASSSTQRVTGKKIESHVVARPATISSDAPASEHTESIEIDDIVKSLEAKGFPFTHTILEEFVNRFQTTPRKNGKLYRQFRYAIQKSEERLAAKYKGRWDSKSIMIDRKPSKQFWLISNEVENAEEDNI